MRSTLPELLLLKWRQNAHFQHGPCTRQPLVALGNVAMHINIPECQPVGQKMYGMAHPCMFRWHLPSGDSAVPSVGWPVGCFQDNQLSSSLPFKPALASVRHSSVHYTFAMASPSGVALALRECCNAEHVVGQWKTPTCFLWDSRGARHRHMVHSHRWWGDSQIRGVYQPSPPQTTNLFSLSVHILHFLFLLISSELSLTDPHLPWRVVPQTRHSDLAGPSLALGKAGGPLHMPSSLHSAPDIPTGWLPAPGRIRHCCLVLWFTPSILHCSSPCVHTADAFAKVSSFLSLSILNLSVNLSALCRF